MEDIAFPPVLKNLINSINAEGRLQSWQLQTTLETYSLTVEWIRAASCDGTSNYKFKLTKSDSRAENSAQASGQTATLLETDRDYDMEANAQGKKGKTVKRYDFTRNCVQSPRDDSNIEGNELNALSESEIPEAEMTENEVKYETQVSNREKRQPEPSTKSKISSFNGNTPFHFSPRKQGGHTAYVSGQVANDKRVTETHSVPFANHDEHKKTAICSCGEVFTSRNLSMSSIIYLSCKPLLQN